MPKHSVFDEKLLVLFKYRQSGEISRKIPFFYGVGIFVTIYGSAT